MGSSGPLEVVDLVVSDPFTQAINQVARFTNSSRAEAGFVAYRNAAAVGNVSLYLSDVLYADYKNENVSEAITTREAARQRHASLNLWPLVDDMYTDEDGEDIFDGDEIEEPYQRIRNDVALNLHSHPSRSLYPSLGDLAFVETLDANNPGVISVILTATGQVTTPRINLLMFRRGNRDLPNLYQRHSSKPPADVLLDDMSKSGYSFQTLHYNTKDQSYDETEASVDQVIARLY